MGNRKPEYDFIRCSAARDERLAARSRDKVGDKPARALRQLEEIDDFSSSLNFASWLPSRSETTQKFIPEPVQRITL